MSEPTGDAAGVSRRSMLKKSVIAGGLAWVAPTVLSNTALADSHGSSFGCTTYCVGKTSSKASGCESNSNGQFCTEKYTENTFDCCSKVTIEPYFDGVKIRVNPGENCVLLKVWAKQGNAPCVLIGENVTSLEYPQELSHVEWELCCRVS